MDEKAYIQGFNQGYLLQKHKPTLAEKLLSAVKDSKRERDQGMIAGAKEYRIEEMNKYLGKQPNVSIERSSDKYTSKTKDKEDRNKGMERD